MNVGENIRSRREQAGMLQADVAEKIGISQAMLSQIERGRKMPSLLTAYDLAQILHCEMEELLEDVSLLG